MDHDIAKLENRLHEVDKKRDALASLHAQLVPIIHRPGWTTIAEYNLVLLAVDAVELHLDSIANLHGKLLSAAESVDPGPTVIKPPPGTGPGPDF
jgi:hypothetical protein